MRATLKHESAHLQSLTLTFPKVLTGALQQQQWRLANVQIRLDSVNPALVLKRGYAWLADARGYAITSVRQTRTGQLVRATLVDGEVDLSVAASPLI